MHLATLRAHGLARRVPWASRLSLALLFIATACQPSPRQQSSPQESGRVGSARPGDDFNPGDDSAWSDGYETWYVIQAQGHRLGLEHSRWRPSSEQGRWLFESRQEVAIAREGDQSRQSITINCTEDAEGKLLEFRTIYDSGGEKNVTEGRVDGQQLILTTAIGELRLQSSLPWPENGRGFSAPMSLFLRRPPRPGEQGEFTALAPVINQLAQVRWKAASKEPVLLQDGSRELLRVDLELVLAQATLKQALWIDDQGRPVQLVDQQTGMTWLKTSREAAETPLEATSFDLNQWASVAVSGRMPTRPHEARRIRYRASLKDGDPSTVFRASARQQVRSISANVAELDVTADWATGDKERQADAAPAAAALDPPSSDDTAASLIIQSEAPRIQRLAEQAAADLQDPLPIARALEHFVQRHISKKGYGRAFQTALETAESREGDCTEHAVLLAALCRARGIPARVVTGLVHHRDAFAYHMWNEVWVDNRWIALDSTLGRGGIGPAHLTIGHADLTGADALADLLPIMSVIGQLSLEVIEVEP